MREVAIVSVTRTAIGNYGGSLKGIPVVDLGATVIRDVLERVKCRPVMGSAVTGAGAVALAGKECPVEVKYNIWDSSFTELQVDEVIMGNVVGAAQGQNVTRQAMIRAGLPREAGGYTINKVCASGLKAVALAAQSIAAGENDVMIAGGMENMSQIPYAMPAARWGVRMGNTEMIDLLVNDGLWEIFYGYHMGLTAENIAELYGISRLEQDELGALSHQRACKAIADGIFVNEIVPVMIPQRKKDPIAFATDERPMETSVEKMGKLRPAFKKDGTVTAGNASGINDAAAAFLLMTPEKAKELGLEVRAVIKGFQSGGLDPAYMGLGPVPAINRLLPRLNLELDAIDYFELNEAFASQAIGCVRELKIDMERTNIYGSGISLGHPIGASGARILVTLLTALEQNDAERGLASLCIGGGQGAAMVIERR
jgi:acetyl-CoA C-acetyltransferase